MEGWLKSRRIEEKPEGIDRTGSQIRAGRDVPCSMSARL
jgi:hypothetical protein